MAKVHVTWTYDGGTATGFKVSRTGVVVATLNDPAVRDYYDDVSAVVDNEAYYEITPFNDSGDEGTCMYNEITLLRQLSRDMTSANTPADHAYVRVSPEDPAYPVNSFEYYSETGWSTFSNGNAYMMHHYYDRPIQGFANYDHTYEFTVPQKVLEVDFKATNNSGGYHQFYTKVACEVYGSNDDTLGTLIGTTGVNPGPGEIYERYESLKCIITSPAVFKKYTMRTVYGRSIQVNDGSGGGWVNVVPIAKIKLMGK